MAIAYAGCCYTYYQQPHLGYGNKALKYNSILSELTAA
jgi:hypothetical protein